MHAITLDLSAMTTLGRAEFYQLCQANPDRPLERLATGELIVMASTGGETGRRNFSLAGEFYLWCRLHPWGQGFDSSTGFALPSGSDRSPDLAWVAQARWDALAPEERQGFVPLCPDFVVELRSPSDSWQRLAAKMDEYMANGCRLGWLIDDPPGRRVAIYRRDRPVETLTTPAILSGEDVLPGFLLDAQFLWVLDPTLDPS
jgi:Uma2 family endonuclease